MKKKILHIESINAGISRFQRMLLSFPSFLNLRKNIPILLNDYLNQRGSWSMKKDSHSFAGMKGSVSGEDHSYVALVKLAVLDDRVFRKFKSNREYREILEHVNREQGASYLEIIRRYNKATQELLDFCQLDICRPFRYSYPSFGKVSPTNLRYAKVALDLNSLFGDLSRFAIAEIGIGYGGQLQAILAQSGFAQYTFYDLDPVVDLAIKYLKNQNLEEFSLTSKTGNSNPNQFDLVISNYAFSELNRDTQEFYLENVISKSKRGYFIYNEITPSDYNSITVDEFCKRVEGCVVVNEYPKTAPRNQLVIWGFESTDRLILD
jgi:putative sugar O-methyltransferase